MSEIAEIKGRPDLTCDVESGAIFCDNTNEHREYTARIARLSKGVKLENEVADLKDQMEEMKSMLRILINK